MPLWSFSSHKQQTLKALISNKENMSDFVNVSHLTINAQHNTSAVNSNHHD